MQQTTDQSLSLVSAVKLWNMSLQNMYLTIWKATVYYMIFNMASDITRKSTGSKTVPRGTPEVTGAISDDSPSRTTVCVRFDKKAEIQGITLQSDLKWTQHANNIVANANKSLGFLKRNLKTSNTNIKSQAYLSLVRPRNCNYMVNNLVEHDKFCFESTLL
jgi:hypothetical protein